MQAKKKNKQAVWLSKKVRERKYVLRGVLRGKVIRLYRTHLLVSTAILSVLGTTSNVRIIAMILTHCRDFIMKVTTC